MNRDYMANMIQLLKLSRINNDIIEEYDAQFEEEPKTLMDIPKDWEGNTFYWLS